jgi:hypothetical protein
MPRVVISQSMYFPWVGMLEQIRLADIFIHYDDVQFSKGSFSNRVQVKTPGGVAWMTAPLQGSQVGPDHRRGATATFAKLERTAFGAARAKPRRRPACRRRSGLAAGDRRRPRNRVRLARQSMLALCRYFGLEASTRFADSRDFGIGGSGSERVLALVKAVGGTIMSPGTARGIISITRF